MIKTELLAPAGNLAKLNRAFYFGADAVYIGGKNFSLRSFADNFFDDELMLAVQVAHEQRKKVYVTVNILARNADFSALEDYFSFLSFIGADAVILSDAGVISLCRKVAPDLPIHISTQASVTNKYSAAFWAEMGAKRIILARELSLSDIKEIRDHLPDSVELEAFCHGAMCVSYSGRCLLSDYFTGRPSNRGQCVQACRWNYELREAASNGEFYPIEEDGRGTYILNSKDLNMIDHLDLMIDAGITSFKIEGRMKTEYYVATVVNAYRRALDDLSKNGASYKNNPLYKEELLKTSHRAFTTAYALGNNDKTINYDDTQSQGDRTFVASVVGYDEEKRIATVEMRNRFFEGDELELLTPFSALNAKITVKNLKNENGESVSDAKIVQQILRFDCETPLHEGDILRK